MRDKITLLVGVKEIIRNPAITEGGGVGGGGWGEMRGWSNILIYFRYVP